MTQEPTPPPKAGEALIVWMKLALLLAGLAAFGGLIFYASRLLATHG